MFHLILISMVSMINICLGAIWDCDTSYSKYPQSAVDPPAGEWCADEGGSCSGPGVVYYGSQLTWTYSDYIADGESISCSNEGFGCDPLLAFTKKCYIKRFRCYDDACTNPEVPPQQGSPYVMIDFSRIRMFKTLSDGGSTEEWFINHDGIRSNTITMNVDFYDIYPNNFWHLNNGCSFDMNEDSQLLNINGNNCEPPESTEDLTNGFYNCYIQGSPKLFVSPDVYENGLKYTLNFQAGDYNIADNEFDNGPIWTTSPSIYTEPDHTSIADLYNNGGIIERYFTRTGVDGRRARFYAKYQLLYLTGNIPSVRPCN
mmetsp:Transcript_4530/g.3964  ORF Transcript_4530/g.3964 Transcript_4530/m.3964 type:complete len:315 (+) Transcript_4530:101-1045(+)